MSTFEVRCNCGNKAPVDVADLTSNEKRELLRQLLHSAGIQEGDPEYRELVNRRVIFPD